MIFFLSAVPEGRLFGLDLQTLISTAIQLFNVSLLAVVLSWLLYKPVRRFLRGRSEHIAAQFARAELDMEQAAALKVEYETKLEDIELERNRVLDEAYKLAADKSRQIVDDARREAAAVRERSAEEIRKERERVGEEIRQQIIEVASAMAEKFVAHAIDQETQDRLFDEAMAELEGIAWQQD